jgi:hypothetical protein
MKNILCLISILLLFSLPVSAQYARRIVPVTTLPANCLPGNGEVVFLTTPAASIGLYECTATNSYKAVGITGNQFLLTQGTLTGSFPFLNHSVTWNNGAVTFVDDFRNVTDTASAAVSLLAQWQVGGADVFTVGKTGDIRTAAAGHFEWIGRSHIHSHADGNINFTNAADTGFTRLNLGVGGNDAWPALTVSAPIGGEAQGIILTKANGANQTFGNLGAATDGSMIYCSDCTIASPCAGGGNGAIAKRLNGAWVCN